MLKIRNGLNFPILVDLLLVIGTLYFVKKLVLQSAQLWTLAGPVALLTSLAIANWRLRDKNESWANLGFTLNVSKKRLAAWTSIALVVTIAVGIFAESAVTTVYGLFDLTVPAIDERYQNRFSHLSGNLPAFIFWLAMAWVIGGFTEELLFRGFLTRRFEQLLPKLPHAIVLAVVLQGVLFGQQHFYYQGVSGWIANGIIGVVSGILYVMFRRNLWPLVLSHGIANSIGLTLLFVSRSST